MVPATPIDLPAGGGVLVTGRGILCGWTLFNPSSSTAATCRLHDGTAASGIFLGAVNLNPSESVRDWLLPGAVLFNRGVFAVNTGPGVQGSVFVIPEQWLAPGWIGLEGPEVP